MTLGYSKQTHVGVRGPTQHREARQKWKCLDVQIVRNPLPMVRSSRSFFFDPRRRVRACMCATKGEGTRSQRTTVANRRGSNIYKRLATMRLERENRERDSHATEALLRTLDDRGRSKGHRYRPACDALRTVASGVEGGHGEQRAKETSRREKRGGGKGSRDGGVPKNDVCVGLLPIDATTSSRVKFKTSHAHAVAYKSTVHYTRVGVVN